MEALENERKGLKMILPKTAIDIKNSLTRVPVAMAQELLERRAPEQRDLSEKKKQHYSDCMKAKEFVWDSGDTIALDTRCLLIDGQTRLSAQVDVNIEGYYLIVFNCNPNSYQVKDQGNRTAAQTFKTAGMPFPNEFPSAVQWYYKIYRGMVASGRNGSISLPQYKCLSLAKSHPGLAETLCFVMSFCPKIRQFYPSQLTAFIHAYGGIGDKKNADFVRSLATGIGCSENDGVYLLRERVMELRTRREVLVPQKYNALLIKALNAWRRGQTIRQLRWLSGEPFPKLEL